MNRAEHRLDTSGRRVVDVTDLVADFCLEDGRDGLVHAFVPHATAGLADGDGVGLERDLEDLLERLLPREDRYVHRHGSTGHGGDHLLPVIVSPSLSMPVEGAGSSWGRGSASSSSTRTARTTCAGCC